MLVQVANSTVLLTEGQLKAQCSGSRKTTGCWQMIVLEGFNTDEDGTIQP
jgi:hypothetical protein